MSLRSVCRSGLIFVCLAMAGCGDGQAAPTAAEQAAAKAQADAVAERKALLAKVSAMLDVPGLVITAPAGAPAIAIEFEGQGPSRSGTVRMVVGGRAIERRITVRVSPSTPPTLICTLAPIRTKGTTAPVKDETITFNVNVVGEGIEFRDPTGRKLQADPTAHAKLTVDFTAAVRKERDLIDAFHAKLGAIAFLDGSPQKALADGRSPACAVLIRTPNKDEYALYLFAGDESTLTKDRDWVATYDVRVEGEQAVISVPFKGVHAPLIQTEGGVAIDLPDATGRGLPAVRRKITRTISAKELAADVVSAKDFVDGLKTTPAKLSGFIDADMIAQPIWLDFLTFSGTQLTGTLHFGYSDAVYTFKAQLTPSYVGYIVQLNGYPLNGKLPTWGDNGNLRFALAVKDGVPTLSGIKPELSATTPQPAQVAALRKRLDDHLAAGGTFTSINAAGPMRGDVLDEIRLSLSGTSELSGEAGWLEPGKVDLKGSVTTSDNLTLIELTVTEPPKSKAPDLLQLWLVPHGDSFYLNGFRRGASEQRGEMVCYQPSEPSEH